MKQAIAGIVAFCIVFFTLLTIFDLKITITSKNSGQEFSPVHLPENKPEHINDRIDTPEEVVKPSSDRETTVHIEPLAKEDHSSTIASEHPATADIEAVPDRQDSPPPKPEKETMSLEPAVQQSLPAGDTPIEGLGLLTDTGETENNGILDPDATQVQPKPRQQALKKAAGPVVGTTIKEEKGMQITVLPEGSYPFSILLGTFDEQNNAKQAVALHRQRGLAAYWVKVDLGSNSGVRYRVFTGSFPSEDAAKKFRTQSRLSGQLVKKTSYAAKIGTFVDKKELAAAFTKTLEAGTFPYILGNEDGPFFLYVGAYYTSDGAENQCRELVDMGLSCKAVLRSTQATKD